MKTAVDQLIEKMSLEDVCKYSNELAEAKEMEEEQRRKDYIKGRKDGIQYESMINYDSDSNDEAENFAKKAEEKFIKSIN
jgi:hypothetical protein